MATFEAFYVPGSADREEQISTIRKLLPEADVTPDEPKSHLAQGFLEVGIGVTHAKPPEAILASVSHELAGDLIWLASQSVVDAFQFIRWTSGELVRALTFGCHETERTWERVEGTPEPWEQEILFTEQNKQLELDCADSLKDHALIDLAWDRGLIQVDSTIPIISSQELCFDIGHHYGFYQ